MLWTLNPHSYTFHLIDQAISRYTALNENLYGPDGPPFIRLQPTMKIESPVSTIKAREMGLEKKMAKLPPDITRDCLSGSSTMGPRIKAIKKGGIGKSNFLMK